MCLSLCCRTLTCLCDADFTTLTCAAEGKCLEHDADYGFFGEELLDAVQAPCKQRGVWCSDINGTGNVLLFERV